MDDTLFVLLPPVGRYVVLFLIPFAPGAPAINSHDVIGIIIIAITIIIIIYIFNFYTAFIFISSCAVFGRVFGIYHICVIFCVRDIILVLIWFITRFCIGWILLISIGFIVSADIEYYHRLIF